MPLLVVLLAVLAPETESSSQTPPNAPLFITKQLTPPVLLLHTLLTTHPTTPLTLHGLDISPAAIALARTNNHHNPPRLSNPTPSHTLTFTLADIFSPLPPHILPQNTTNNTIPPKEGKEIDLLISNPPYISPTEFSTATARAVRNHEPRLALIPLPSLSSSLTQKYKCQPEDVFYARLLEITAELRPKRVVLEVGGLEQALRVVRLAGGFLDGGKGGNGKGNGGYGTVEVWRDEVGGGGGVGGGDRGERVVVEGREVVVRGQGRGRVVYLERHRD